MPKQFMSSASCPILSPFLHFMSYFTRLCHLTLIYMNEISPKVNNAVINYEEHRLQRIGNLLTSNG